MLRWIADVNSLNPQIWHIVGKDNVMADMLSRARFEDGFAKSEEQEVSEDYFAMEQVYQVCTICEFWENEYERETLRIGRMLQSNHGVSSLGEDIRKRKKKIGSSLKTDWSRRNPRSRENYR